MSAPQSPITYEQMMALFLETREQMKETDRKMEEAFQGAMAIAKENQKAIGAVAGAVVEGDAAEFAQENGMYVIVQSGKAVEILTPPEGFKPKEW